MDDGTITPHQGNSLPKEIYIAINSWYSNKFAQDAISAHPVEHSITHTAETQSIYIATITTTLHPHGLSVRVFVNHVDETYVFQQLYERGERPYFNVEEEIEKLTAWCQQHFKEHKVEIREMAELPIPYPNKCVGYRNLVAIQNHPRGEYVDMITNEESMIIDFQYVQE